MKNNNVCILWNNIYITCKLFHLKKIIENNNENNNNNNNNGDLPNNDNNNIAIENNNNGNSHNAIEMVHKQEQKQALNPDQNHNINQASTHLNSIESENSINNQDEFKQQNHINNNSSHININNSTSNVNQSNKMSVSIEPSSVGLHFITSNNEPMKSTNE